MKIFLRLCGPLERYGGHGINEISLQNSIKASQLLSELQIPSSLKVLIVVNGVKVTGDYNLQAGDIVVLFPPVSGG
ncbi:MoaD/ThiS family protein [Desulfoscipio geothermicus]|uniref:ThiS family protein n=1 Tax=Desulfoscipio geothermicus DSM 3669 TaxID=1121426 RepID=A0A1I6DIF9_9FIRM|nr:ThiS family protein [Desulfoscipio geothermicus DSM 3669]